MGLLYPYEQGVSCLSFIMPTNVKEFLVQFWCSWNGRHGNYRKNGVSDPPYMAIVQTLSRVTIPYIGGRLIDNPQEWLTQRRSQVRVLFRPPFYPHLWGFLFAIGHFLVQLIKLNRRDPFNNRRSPIHRNRMP